MVDTQQLADTNGEAVPADPVRRPDLPEVVRLTAADGNRIPSPGTQRVLKAQTGRNWDTMYGPGADSADRFQTMVWMVLRRTIPDLHWADCADVEIEIDDGAVDPTRPAGSVSSPPSVASGGLAPPTSTP